MGTQTVWELTGATGAEYAVRLGNTLAAVETRDARGLLSGLKTMKGSMVVHQMNFAFNGVTGNLTSRTGMLPQTETFEYDSADRLTAVKHGSSNAMSIGYARNGNIISKTGVGQYGYGSKPHAVTSVENSGNLISHETQQISYTAFNKVSRITEQAGGVNLMLDFDYGPDRQRWKTELKRNGNIERCVIFAGDYERVTENGQTRQLYYIGGGNGWAALYVKQPGMPDKIYYPHTDHLGSIVKLTDGEGTEVFKAAYDAWGNRTVSDSTFSFHRGYTGHEHLPWFGLIDMNGRMYDPILGRFLSPDPYVQMADYSQNFNRYSYCLNNPLIYTDPSGENPLIAFLAFTAFNAFSAGMQADFNGQDVFKAVAKSLVVSAASAILPAAIGQVFGHGLGTVGNELLRAGAHGLANGGINALEGGNFYKGFAIGAASSLVGSGMQAAGLDGAYLPFITGATGSGTAWALGESPYRGFMQGYGIGALNHKGEKIIGDDGKEYILSFDDVIITANNPLAFLSYPRPPMQSGRLSNVYPEFDLLMLGRGIFNMFSRSISQNGAKSLGAAAKGFTRHINYEYIKGVGKVESEVLHRSIKPKILNQAGKYRHIVGKNPDISVENGLIFLKGTGTYKGATFRTHLRSIDFFTK